MGLHLLPLPDQVQELPPWFLAPLGPYKILPLLPPSTLKSGLLSLGAVDIWDQIILMVGAALQDV